VHVHQLNLSELVDHYRQRELKPDILWKTHSTKVTYDGYLNKWIMPRWGNYTLNRISAGEVEIWLRSLALAKSKLREHQKYHEREDSGHNCQHALVPSSIQTC
jgi:hypothetical protein